MHHCGRSSDAQAQQTRREPKQRLRIHEVIDESSVIARRPGLVDPVPASILYDTGHVCARLGCCRCLSYNLTLKKQDCPFRGLEVAHIRLGVTLTKVLNLSFRGFLIVAQRLHNATEE